jgi:RimJ/RimL family protein N-acetyltransferase
VPAGQTLQHPFACSDYESQLGRDSSSLLPVPTLETERPILRSFREEDIDRMTQLFANPDFMRFSLGVSRNANTLFFSSRKSWTGIAPAFRRSLPSARATQPQSSKSRRKLRFEVFRRWRMR